MKLGFWDEKQRYYSGTIRKANCVNVYFAKATRWDSFRVYQIGNCENTITISNIPLGGDKEKFYNRFMDFIKKNIKD